MNEPVNVTHDRFTVIITKEHHAALAHLAKAHKISQGEVIEVLLDRAEQSIQRDELLVAAFRAKRELKVDNRGKKSDLFLKFKKLTPEQISFLEKWAMEEQL